MITGDYDHLKEIARDNVCSEHGTPLEIAWYGTAKTSVLRCGHDHYPDRVTRQLSLTQMHKAGIELPEPIKSNVEKGIRRRAMTQGKQPQAKTFSGVPTTDLATGELLTLEVVKALVRYTHRYQLDPRRGHVVMMYGKPYITIDGYLYHANQTKQAYKLNSRPLTADERKTYQIGEEDYAWVAEIIMDEGKRSFIGLGIVTKEEMILPSKRDPSIPASPVVAKHPWQLTQKRAEWQACRRAFPIGETEEEKEE